MRSLSELSELHAIPEVCLRLRQVAHELRVPIVALRNGLDFLARESNARGYKYSHDCISDMAHWIKALGLLVEELDMPVVLHPSQTSMTTDIIVPVIRQAMYAHSELGICESQIGVQNLDVIPMLSVDANCFRRAIFYLIDNAIKYRDALNGFRLTISGEATAENFLIHFCDFGMGVTPQDADRVFEPGFRGVHSVNLGPGNGLGLTSARHLLRLHGGDIDLRRAQVPTTFVITVPRSLAVIGQLREAE